jgi:hypothetical protein
VFLTTYLNLPPDIVDLKRGTQWSVENRLDQLLLLFREQARDPFLNLYLLTPGYLPVRVPFGFVFTHPNLLYSISSFFVLVLLACFVALNMKGDNCSKCSSISVTPPHTHTPLKNQITFFCRGALRSV